MVSVTLKSQDEKTFVVPREVAEKSVLLKNMLEDVGESDAPIPLPNVTGKVLEKVC
jgi:S-phase kinase-associated protein 1